MAKNNKYFTVNAGVSLILLVFLILSLVSFAALSIVSARADARLTEKYRLQTTGYYRARNESQKYLLTLEQELAADPAAHPAGVFEARFPVTESQELVLRGEILPEGRIRVLGNQIKSTASYNYDSTLPVIRK